MIWHTFVQIWQLCYILFNSATCAQPTTHQKPSFNFFLYLIICSVNPPSQKLEPRNSLAWRDGVRRLGCLFPEELQYRSWPRCNISMSRVKTENIKTGHKKNKEHENAEKHTPHFSAWILHGANSGQKFLRKQNSKPKAKWEFACRIWTSRPWSCWGWPGLTLALPVSCRFFVLIFFHWNLEDC